MTDREFLIWIHERLAKVHGERELVDYMHRLRGIIEAMPADRETGRTSSANGMDELVRKLPHVDALRAEGWLKRLWRGWIEQRWEALGRRGAHHG